MNDVLDFLGTVREVARVYLWLVFAAATALLITDLVKHRSAKVDRQETRERKAA